MSALRAASRKTAARVYTRHAAAGILLLSCSLPGCGLSVPRIQEIWDTDIAGIPGTNGAPKLTGSTQIEFEIQKRVYCELKEAVRAAQTYSVGESDTIDSLVTAKQYGLIPSDWSALIALSLQVDESSSLSPGLSLNTVLPNGASVFGPGSGGTVSTSQSRSVGLGATLSSTATRIDKWNPVYSVAFLNMPPRRANVCERDPFVEDAHVTPARSSPLLIESDLGIKDWLLGAMFVNNMLASSDSGGSGKPTISYEVKFVIVSNANVTPAWKLVRLTANTAGTFFSTGRTRTHDLIITIGPTAGAQGVQTSNVHLAAQIGQAVRGGNTTLTMP